MRTRTTTNGGAGRQGDSRGRGAWCRRPLYILVECPEQVGSLSLLAVCVYGIYSASDGRYTAPIARVAICVYSLYSALDGRHGGDRSVGHMRLRYLRRIGWKTHGGLVRHGTRMPRPLPHSSRSTSRRHTVPREKEGRKSGSQADLSPGRPSRTQVQQQPSWSPHRKASIVQQPSSSRIVEPA
ncbi:hypothetical protein VTK73DRAFT_5131 [Phialemonium thermophilum]|uniref:Uncharacterized protein n=1 Tax=Phialemonium thermophilum TaxID=223376 RepID=A0ABR3V362_9PEZI